MDKKIKELQTLLDQYNSIRTTLQTERSKCKKLKNTVMSSKSYAEREGMFLEDCLAHATPKLIPYMSDYIPISKSKAKRLLIDAYDIWKANPIPISDNAKIKKDIDEMVAYLPILNQQLIDEEAAISELRAKELESKEKEDEEYEKMIQKLHKASDTFTEIHNLNKEKKQQLISLQQHNKSLNASIDDLKNRIEQSKLNFVGHQKEMDTVSKQKEELIQETQLYSSKEKNLNQIRMENAELSQQEVSLIDKIGELTAECQTKKQKLQAIFIQIQNNQDYFDKFLNFDKEEASINLSSSDSMSECIELSNDNTDEIRYHESIENSEDDNDLIAKAKKAINLPVTSMDEMITRFKAEIDRLSVSD